MKKGDGVHSSGHAHMDKRSGPDDNATSRNEERQVAQAAAVNKEGERHHPTVRSSVAHAGDAVARQVARVVSCNTTTTGREIGPRSAFSDLVVGSVIVAESLTQTVDDGCRHVGQRNRCEEVLA